MSARLLLALAAATVLVGCNGGEVSAQEAKDYATPKDANGRPVAADQSGHADDAR